MKSFSFIHFILLIILMLAYTCAGAQDRVITTAGDTIIGKVSLLNYGTMPKVQVHPEGGKKMVKSMFEAREVVFQGDTFHPQKGPRGYTFMKLVKGGYLSLYKYQLENQTTYDGLILIKKDGTSMEVPNLTFKKAMANYLSECAEISEKLDAGEYSKKDLELIIDQFNKCIKENNVVIQVEKSTNNKQLDQWIAFEKEVTNHPDFGGKTDAIEIVQEIRKKVEKSEKVPNFTVQSLRVVLKDTDLNEQMEKLIAELM